MLFRQGERLSMGFSRNGVSREGGSLETAALRDSIYGGVPEEILNRFAAPISISPLTKSDCEQALTHVHEKLNEPMPKREKLDELSDQAVREGIGFRWVERYLTELAIQRMERQPQSAPVLSHHSDAGAEMATGCHSEKEFSEYVAEIQEKAREEEETVESDSEEESSRPRWQAKSKPTITQSISDSDAKGPSKIWEVTRLLAVNVRNSANDLLLDLPDAEAIKLLSEISVAAQNIKDQVDDPSVELANAAQIVDVFFGLDHENAKMCHTWRDLSHRFPDIAARKHLELWIQTLRQFLLKAEESYRR